MCSSDLLDALWAEAGPVLTVYLYNWSLNVAQRHNVITCFIIEGDINSVVSQTSTVKGFFSSGALDASWLGVNGDCHFLDLPLSALAVDANASSHFFRSVFKVFASLKATQQTLYFVVNKCN